MIRRLSALVLALGGSTLLLGAAAVLAKPFDHWQHRKLFLDCATCHAGPAGEGRLFPAAADCASCHDGTVEKEVAWTPREGPSGTNLKFTHDAHRKEFLAEHADSSLACSECHSRTPASPEWMRVVRGRAETCFACHGTTTPHFDQPDTACVTCHVPVWQAPAITTARMAAWKAPASHDAPGFAATGHGEAAEHSASGSGPNQSCATCHARDFCASCHVNAPEQPVIMALARDARSRAIEVEVRYAKPASHDGRDFATTHGRGLGRADLTSCASCHAQESCTTCHLAPPRQVQLIPAWNRSPDRARGVLLARNRPLSHGRDYTDAHGAPAASNAQSCAGCHTLEQCSQCHRPDAAAEGTYHPADYLVRHPTAAYAQEVTCSDCHNTGQFCQSCHEQSGLYSKGALGTRGRFHDANTAFIAGHGVAARQSLESCTSCHVETDCLACHSAIGGRRFNPHGPGFDAETLRRKNPQMCVACHGAAIPRVDDD